MRRLGVRAGVQGRIRWGRPNPEVRGLWTRSQHRSVVWGSFPGVASPRRACCATGLLSSMGLWDITCLCGRGSCLPHWGLWTGAFSPRCRLSTMGLRAHLTGAAWRLIPKGLAVLLTTDGGLASVRWDLAVQFGGRGRWLSAQTSLALWTPLGLQADINEQGAGHEICPGAWSWRWE